MRAAIGCAMRPSVGFVGPVRMGNFPYIKILHPWTKPAAPAGRGVLGRVPGRESPGLHGDVFHFFVQMFVTEKSANVHYFLVYATVIHTLLILGNVFVTQLSWALLWSA
ncbi:hypothetical protein PROFUN_01589 [Planoprotostelium fungivorum]|uniref:Uncharacterized protein n=1 Tax=Planoprotostelium fungivorum TaxID=1890364 RepID=A0A2P6NTM5_9EUKA|nr:hypothetical protein PROFUN_01589 [Planoprotostelium fungivorum]